jgi:uncharacterized protein (TIGR02996 family)
MVPVMTHEDAFLADILEHPADDTPRLVYADWLEEHGQAERAEFIRVQCAIAVDPLADKPPPSNPRCACSLCALRRRERELLNDAVHWWNWLADFYRITGQSAIGDLDRPSDRPTLAVRWRRGFVAEVTLPCQAWLEHGPALVRAAPLERVTLSDRQPSRWYRLGWGEWYWVRQAGPTPHVPDRLPPELCALLSTGRVDEDGVMTYLSRERAQDALSRACLGWARDVMVPGRREGV